MHIFVVEDEPIIRRELKVLLENALYQVTAPDGFSDVLAQIMESRPDLVLLDVNLPGVSGFDICTRIREETEVPVIFLTSRTDSMDELTGILKGGDDYITKPYQAPLLLARIGAVLKRTRGGKYKEATRLTRRGVTLDISGCSLSFQGQCTELTKNEMKLLHILFLHSGEFVSRMDLVEYLWENQIFIDDNTLSVHVARIREKLKNIGVNDLIETKRGMGYRV
ncbi:MAG: response regulator transcription factor [Dorea sp.]|jgi:two-component system response regulator protein BraR/BceR|nr:response regulator transcription factor [Dorea sp.]